MKKITITGTKGKTTVSNVLASVLRQIEPKVLHVDTNGAYVNGKLEISKKQSQQMWDVVPTVAPGRFLYLMVDDNDLAEDGMDHVTLPGAAVLEASLGCGTVSGLGYYGHDIGIFTNVYEDHLGSRPDLVSRKDIGASKRFIFSRINRDGTAVFNADDDVVCGELKHCKPGVTLLPFGRSFDYFDLQGHLDSGGYALTIEDKKLVLLHKVSKTQIMDIADVSWAFEGMYEPSLYNLMAISAALFAYNDFAFSDDLIQKIAATKLDPYSGRLTLLETKGGIKILADYAHEKQSLQSIAALARDLKQPEGRTIGVLRLSWDRTEQLVRETADFIAQDYDRFVIYDKIDGYWRQPSSRFRTGQRQFTQEVGKISGWLSDALKDKRGDEAVEQIMREDYALERAAEIARPGDVVVVIVNDDIERSIGFIRETFQADFV